MAKQPTLKPIDVVVALQLTIQPNELYANLARDVAISVSEAHGSVRRLTESRLLQPGDRRVVAQRFWRFLRHGVPYAFPPHVGANAIGVPTAASAPVFADRLAGAESVVWPHADGTHIGIALTPLFRRAPELRATNPELYARLTILDSMRMSIGRELDLAVELMSAAIGVDPRA